MGIHLHVIVQLHCIWLSVSAQDFIIGGRFKNYLNLTGDSIYTCCKACTDINCDYYLKRRSGICYFQDSIDSSNWVSFLIKLWFLCSNINICLHVWQFSNPFLMVSVSEKKRSKQITLYFLLKTQDFFKKWSRFYYKLADKSWTRSLEFLKWFYVTFTAFYRHTIYWYY